MWRHRLIRRTGVDFPAFGVASGEEASDPLVVHAERPVTIADRVGAYEAAAADWHARYGLPFWVAETSNLGLPADHGSEWLAALVAGLDRLAGRGLPVRGVCWYSRGDQVDWDTMLSEPVGRVTEVGLFDGERRPRRAATALEALAGRRLR